MASEQQRVIEVVAHRGMGAEFVQPDQPPENTLESINAAWAAGADACEIDVHLTSDEQVIVIHDDTTGRTGDIDLRVADYTLAELQKLSAGGWKGQAWSNVRFPTLGEVLDSVPHGKRLIVEIKTGPAIVRHLADVIQHSNKLPEQVVIISFNYESLAASKAALPDHRHYFLVVFEFDSDANQWNVAYDRTKRGTQDFETVWQKPADTARLMEMVRQYGFDGIDVSQAQPDDFFLQMQEAGLDWIVWTVDTPEMGLAMAVKGAMSITTNRFQYITQVLQMHGYQTGPVGPSA